MRMRGDFAVNQFVLENNILFDKLVSCKKINPYLYIYAFINWLMNLFIYIYKWLSDSEIK